MTEDQLLYFTSIVECGSYSEAALDLNISVHHQQTGRTAGE